MVGADVAAGRPDCEPPLALGGVRPEVLLVDNYDSFSYTIVGYLEELGARVTVVRNDEECPLEAFAGVLISPGPGSPQQAGRSMAVIAQCLEQDLPVFGVCLGMQALAEVCGATVGPTQQLLHGATSLVSHTGAGVFAGAPQPVRVARYHSLAVVEETLPPELEVTARTEAGVIMGLRHRFKRAEGVQFHPEAVQTQGGHRMLAIWLETLGLTGAVERAGKLSPLVCRG
ncbi:MAG: gamma-glutamyl-gamma-aminobutyrate hydrolase family protein [Buchananella hordeovulneris]|nr:gamma-glutamyl-gamma-aminobutyrate hydrolase family protein [Buchananella hordeovulneris]